MRINKENNRIEVQKQTHAHPPKDIYQKGSHSEAGDGQSAE